MSNYYELKEEFEKELIPNKYTFKREGIDEEPFMFLDAEKGDLKVPCSNVFYDHIPFLPSECNKIIKLFETLRDNFTDEEIKDFNKEQFEQFIKDEMLS